MQQHGNHLLQVNRRSSICQITQQHPTQQHGNNLLQADPTPDPKSPPPQGGPAGAWGRFTWSKWFSFQIRSESRDVWSNIGCNNGDSIIHPAELVIADFALLEAFWHHNLLRSKSCD